MGISGLLPLLKSIHKATHLRNFSGQTLGVDAYGWLHRGTVACAIELAQGKPTRKHIEFALHRVRMLIHFGIKPYLVFDGDYLPSKAHTEKGRAARRKESKRVGLDLLRMGRTSQAQQELQKAVDVTPLMARELIEELKLLDLPYVVAPYEADSQLAYLEKQGIISGVISEDSDLLVFGVNRLLTKLDQYGECIMIDRADFTSCREISLVGWTNNEFRMMAMLSGCDYLPGIEKLGLKTAYRLIRKHKTVEKIVRIVQFDGKSKVPADYLESFTKAERTFLHQWVYCAEARQVLNLTPLPAGLEADSLPYLGTSVDAETAAGVARGDLDPNTKQPLILPSRFQNRATEHRTVSTPVEKQGKPITEFFRRRTPLAELDPNSFTPSPSQQRLLQSQANLSWSASQIDATRRPESMGTTAGLGMSSAPQPLRRTATLPAAAVHQQTPKRQRLCSDPAIAIAMDAATSVKSATSRFFAKPPAQDSPSVQKKLRRSEKDQEFELWSDDSIVDALAEAASLAVPVGAGPANLSSPRKRKKLNVFADSADLDKSATSNAESQSTETSTLSLESRLSVSQVDTPATSVSSSPAPANRISSTTKNNTPIQKVHSLRKYSSLESQEKRPHISLSRSHTAHITPSRRGDDTPAQPYRDSKLVQVGASPAKERSSPNDHVALDPPKVGRNEDETSIADEERHAPERGPLNHLTSGFAVYGSEDLLVPQSPEQEEGEDEENGTRSRSSSSLDLGRFMFAG